MKLILIFLIGLIHWNALPSSKIVRIGMASNFSELSTLSFNPYGGYFRNGVKLALEQNQEKLNKKGILIELQEFDYGSDDLKVIKTVKDADLSGVSAVIGYNYSSNALLAAPLHVKARLPMLSPSASANRLGSFGKYIHLGSISNQYMAHALAKFAFQILKVKRILIVEAVNCAYCVDLSKTFEEEFIRFGGEISKKIPILQEDKDFGREVALLSSVKFDAVFLPTQELTAARVISSFLDAGISRPFLGADGWGNEGSEFFAVIKGRKIEGYSITHWHPNLKTASSQKFVKDYFQKYKKTPNDTSVLAFDFMNFLIEAILGSEKHDRESIEESLRKIKEFRGVTGHYLMESNQAPAKDVLILKTTGSDFKINRVISVFKGKQ